MKYYAFVVLCLTDLVQHFFFAHIGARVLIDINFICFGYIARHPSGSGEQGGILLVQMISTCLRYAEEGEGGQHHVVHIRTKLDFFMIIYHLAKVVIWKNYYPVFIEFIY